MTTTQAAQKVRIKNLGVNIGLQKAIIMAVRHYKTIGEFKKARPLINKVIARSEKISYDWKTLVKGYQQFAKECLTREKDEILQDWEFFKVLEKIAPLILENETFQRIALNALAEGVFSLKDPFKFVQRFSTYTDSDGRIYGKKTTLEEDENGKKVFITRFAPISLTALNAPKILENAFSNFHRMRKNAVIGGKLDICYRVSNGQIYAKYEAIKGENGEYLKGERIK